MGAANLAGPGSPDLSPPERAAPEQIRHRICSGEWVVDLRDRVAFAAGFVPLTLLGETPEQVAGAQRELVRIGIDRLEGASTGHPADWADGRALRNFPVADFADLAAVRHHRPVVILDVRRDQEWASSHIDGAVHIPLHNLPGRLAEVPDGEVWVHCEAGYRASVAASFLDAAGRTVVAVGDEYSRAAGTGLPQRGPGFAGLAPRPAAARAL